MQSIWIKRAQLFFLHSIFLFVSFRLYSICSLIPVQDEQKKTVAYLYKNNFYKIFLTMYC